MISPELFRRHKFFADLDPQQINVLVAASREQLVEAGHYFFHAGEELEKFYFVIAGEVDIVISVPDRSQEHRFVDQLYGTLMTEDIPVASVGPGEMFGWSALVPPHQSTASAKARKYCRVIEIDSKKLEPSFESDCRFAYLMILKAAQTVRERFKSLRIETLVQSTNLNVE